MEKVLHIMAGVGGGGISSVVANYYNVIDRSKIHFDIAVTTDADGVNGKRLRDMGATIYRISLKSENKRDFIDDIKSLIKREHYDVIHVHENETSWVALKAAKECGVNIRIAHSHTAGPQRHGMRSILRAITGMILNGYYATTLIACGKKAGEFVFGKHNMKQRKSIILPNAIDTTLYTYNHVVRNTMRRELGLTSAFVVGMVGRMSKQKNTLQAISIFSRIKKEIPNAILVMAGDGEDLFITKEAIRRMGLRDSVFCLGERNDVNKLLCAFDVYMLPSLYEGFPVAAVEAMATGLPVLLSDLITPELSFGSAVRYLSLDDEQSWVDSAKDFINDNGRENRLNELVENGLDIRNTVSILENVYLKGNV